MMFCPKCGKKQNNGAKFCYYCGNIIEIPAQDNESMLDNDSKTIDSEDNRMRISADNITESSYDYDVKEQDEHVDDEEDFTDEIDSYEKDLFLIDNHRDNNTPSKEKNANITRNDKTNKKSKNGNGIGTAILVIIILSVMIALIGGVIFLVYDSTNKPFESEKKMKDSVKGVYSLYEENPHTKKEYLSKQLNISDEIVVERDSYILELKIEYGRPIVDNNYYINKWDYTNKIIEAVDEFYYNLGHRRATDTFKVLPNGNILFNDKTYRRGGKWESIESIHKRQEQFLIEQQARKETVESAIEITVDKLSPPYDSSYQKCTGTIKNTGINTYKYVKLKGVFKDKYGNVIDTDWTYAVDSEGIAPGESKKFELSVKKDRSIDSCSVSILKDD